MTTPLSRSIHDRAVSGILLIMAHPDDETMGAGGTVARHALAGVEVQLICLTRGEAGWLDRPPGDSGELAQTRTTELHQAAAVLGISTVELWEYPDGRVAERRQAEIVARIADHIRRTAPTVVVGWGPDGAYGHPDHIAAGAFTDSAVLRIPESERPALYHMALDKKNEAGYRAVIEAVGQDPNRWAIVAFDQVSVVFEFSRDEVDRKVAAIDCHESQIQEWRALLRTAGSVQRSVYGREAYIRVPKMGNQQVLRKELFPELRRR
jgi:LmbE family N-acetylglucosaminyl deacetylase